jgi:N-acetylglucosamine kinase-like BadF-type ATPase
MEETQGTRHVIGLDAGGTKTIGLLADENGEVVREARAGGANFRVTGELGIEKTLYEVILALDPPVPLGALCLGIAGADRPPQVEIVREVIARLGFRRRVRVVNDAVIALVAGTGDGLGVVVVAGTGSIAYGRDASGKTARSGGWGYLLGDEASAFWIGHAAVRQGIRGVDGRGPATSLFDRICERVGVTSPQDLADWFYGLEMPRIRVAELAPVVQEAADDGDEAADQLLDMAADLLARSARAVDRQLSFPEGYPLVLSGGTFRACPSLVTRFETVLGLPHATVSRLTVEPARGAVLLAVEELHRA